MTLGVILYIIYYYIIHIPIILLYSILYYTLFPFRSTLSSLPFPSSLLFFFLFLFPSSHSSILPLPLLFFPSPTTHSFYPLLFFPLIIPFLSPISFLPNIHSIRVGSYLRLFIFNHHLIPFRCGIHLLIFPFPYSLLIYLLLSFILPFNTCTTFSSIGVW